MTLSNRPLLPAGEREDECGPKLIRPWLSKPSWDPETETTASCRDFWKKKTDYPPGPPPGEGEMHLPSPEAFPSLSGSPVPRPLAGRGGAACLHLALRHRFWRLLRMRCGSRGGCRGPPSATSRLGAATGGRVEAAAARRGRELFFFFVRSPQSAPVQPGTAGPGYRLRRRRGQSGIQEPWGTDFVGVPMSTRHSQRWRSWTTSVDIARPRDRALTFVARGARSGAVRSSSQNFRIVTTPMHVPQCF